MIITGIGSRETPLEICELFTELGEEARHRDWWIRSGHADGADYAFELGAKENCIAYLPWRGFNKGKQLLGKGYAEPFREEVFKIVCEYQPYAKDLSRGVQLIKSRNIYQVLGINLKTPSDLLICWTPDGAITGGTGLAIKVALQNEIPVINMGGCEESSEKLSMMMNKVRDLIEEIEN